MELGGEWPRDAAGKTLAQHVELSARMRTVQASLLPWLFAVLLFCAVLQTGLQQLRSYADSIRT